MGSILLSVALLLESVQYSFIKIKTDIDFVNMDDAQTELAVHIWNTELSELLGEGLGDKLQQFFSVYSSCEVLYNNIWAFLFFFLYIYSITGRCMFL